MSRPSRDRDLDSRCARSVLPPPSMRNQPRPASSRDRSPRHRSKHLDLVGTGATRPTTLASSSRTCLGAAVPGRREVTPSRRRYGHSPESRSTRRSSGSPGTAASRAARSLIGAGDRRWSPRPSASSRPAAPAGDNARFRDGDARGPALPTVAESGRARPPACRTAARPARQPGFFTGGQRPGVMTQRRGDGDRTGSSQPTASWATRRPRHRALVDRKERSPGFLPRSHPAASAQSTLVDSQAAVEKP